MDNLEEFKNINEGSLSRIWRHITGHEAAIITAFRGKNEFCVHDTDKGKVFSKPENMDRNRQLNAALLKLKYSVTSLDGIYIEGYGTDDAKRQNENSFLVVNQKDDKNFKKKIKELGELFCQDSVLIIEKGGENAYLLGTNKDWPGLGRKENQGRFVPKGEGEFMSSKGNASFIFVKEDAKSDKRYVIVEDFRSYDNLERMGKWAITSISESVIDYLHKKEHPIRKRK